MINAYLQQVVGVLPRISRSLVIFGAFESVLYSC